MDVLHPPGWTRWEQQGTEATEWPCWGDASESITSAPLRGTCSGRRVTDVPDTFVLLLVGTLASFASWLAGMGCEATGIAQWLLPIKTKRKLYSTLRVGREALVRRWPMESVSKWLDRLRSLPPAVLNQMVSPA